MDNSLWQQISDEEEMHFAVQKLCLCCRDGGFHREIDNGGWIFTN